MVLLTTTPTILSAISLLPTDSPLRRKARTASTITTAPKTSSSSSTTKSDDLDLASPSNEEGGRKELLEEDEQEEEDEGIATITLPTSLETPISHKSLIALYRALKEGTDRRSDNIKTGEDENGEKNNNKNGKEGKKEPITTLDQLTRGTRPYFAPPPPRPRPSTSYLALKARLLRDQERREYEALVHGDNKNLSRSTAGLYKDGLGRGRGVEVEKEEDEEDPLTPSLILNILLSVILCAVSVFYVSARLSLPSSFKLSSSSSSSSPSSFAINDETNDENTGHDINSSTDNNRSEPSHLLYHAKNPRHVHVHDGVRVLLSLATAILVGVAESVIYAAYVRKVREARAKERNKRETKLVPVVEDLHDVSVGGDAAAASLRRRGEREERKFERVETGWSMT